MTINVHFVGIGGIHMSALAHILLDDGLVVSGCDRSDAPILDSLRARGANILIGHNEHHVTTATQVVRTAAVPESHPEVARALELGIPVQTRAELLSEIAAPRNVITVGGTHGKTTTTGMIAHCMRASGRDVGYVIGGEAPDFCVHARRGTDPWLVLEADEYGRAFHHYTPSVAVLTNCEPDHLDYYGSQDALEAAFLQYVETLNTGGVLVVGSDSPAARQITQRLSAARSDVRVVTCSSRGDADYAIRDLDDEYLLSTPSGQHRGALQQPGEYQLQNATTALAALQQAGFDLGQAVEALRTFRGVNRRFQLHGDAEGVIVLDDYAHHPTEVSAAIDAAKQRWPERRTVVLFQPHTYTRTSYLLDGFRTCFGKADVVYTVDTYAARDMSGEETTSEQLAAEIDAPDAEYGGSIEQSARLAAERATANDLIITMGAGDIDAAGPIILRELRRSGGGSA
ncbi:MAG: UDP-N-acetylmuramate--L-alanine ligase [Chloroflexi bacterium]|nr:UDP-N-acetylmuramate--L-alanine ligase [Chloroflexota bacterium]MYB22776.1 UDP-N-acetylmuramate--L-alanine ligase [Chloroflexota bacterium]MYF22071.1 UDP-N-acetylmuramate--L-alanine ligase [Chloroflexota bacterium]MYF80224.1 UDP-N-acetylmuramate--L-alanine ligase [Chloroflexota bacterium]MYI03757.1 UDP-N-acetylmuramate--L-alanine ligase [Chloroflexota bacterium]